MSLVFPAGHLLGQDDGINRGVDDMDARFGVAAKEGWHPWALAVDGYGLSVHFYLAFPASCPVAV
jgi:hypothetical protein